MEDEKRRPPDIEAQVQEFQASLAALERDMRQLREAERDMQPEDELRLQNRWEDMQRRSEALLNWERRLRPFLPEEHWKLTPEQERLFAESDRIIDDMRLRRGLETKH